MTQPRLRLERARWAQCVPLQPNEVHRLVDVLRLHAGAEIELFDGHGGVGRARLERQPEGWVLVGLGPVSICTREGPLVRLGVALLKGRKLDDVIRQATEIGVANFSPFVSRRSVARPDGERQRGRRERWMAIAAEAARQSGRSRIPEVAPVVELPELLREPVGTRILLHEKGDVPHLLDCLAGSTDHRLLLVGPEGGFCEDEVASALEAGFTIAGLGRGVLRAETAALAAAVLACLDSGVGVG